MSQSVHAPYHFVPLSKWVYMPDWAHLVSHDVPFQDGLSGKIEYTLTNKTPLCVGAEQNRKNDNEPSLVSFARNPNHELVIPGSSLKGMLRSVLESVTFGKFSQFDDQRFSFRDLSKSTNNYLKNIIGQYPPRSGWLKFDSTKKQWSFTPCSAAKIHHDEIKQHLGIKIRNDDKATVKYDKLPLTRIVSAVISAPRGKGENSWAEHLSSGEVKGHVVFTNKRIFDYKKSNPHNYEFSYFFHGLEEHNRKYDVARQALDLLANHDENHVEYLKNNAHPALGIPVFALMKGSTIHSFGLAKMPRASYKNSTKELMDKLNLAHTSSMYFDMAELMFGTLRDNGLGLKSRISFSDAIADNASESDLYESNLLILNGPKPTFYPAYVEQHHNQTGYMDYDNTQPLAGTKRYITKTPSDKRLVSNIPVNKTPNKKVASLMELCPTDKQFSGHIVFHNLKPLELGALLWTLQLESGCYHQLGHGKPMGAGAVELTPRIQVCFDHQGECGLDTDGLVTQFIAHMESVHPAKQWRASPQVEYVLAMGRMTDNVSLNTCYMSLDSKEFQKAKTGQAKLPLLHGLTRNEPMANYASEKTPSLAFGKGRLAALFTQSDNNNDDYAAWCDCVKNACEKRDQNLREARERELVLAQEVRVRDLALAREAERKASMSQHQWLVEELAKNLEGVDNSERPPLIRNEIEFFLANVDKSQAEWAKSLYQLARKHEYHQKPKKKAKEQKVELARLLELYGVSL
ncbi:TIGR03986 family CRISPR-associated RAMP protein [Photobacterium damselae]|nr:TIGR03986 family CRISPR-associated RAMP protein [Photobacterium damselae]EHA1083008.1 TIGR03986 family CRISPR-associated RAMP protein [Photobacterium damselae]